jgi:hypothetical protein
MLLVLTVFPVPQPLLGVRHRGEDGHGHTPIYSNGLGEIHQFAAVNIELCNSAVNAQGINAGL